MSLNEQTGSQYRNHLKDIEEQGLFKEERLILSPQNAEIEVAFPSGTKPRRVINICANNYLGLSSHPEVIEAAHQALDRWGYGMSSVRFICGTQNVHRGLRSG